jgi:hypothetical protein
MRNGQGIGTATPAKSSALSPVNPLASMPSAGREADMKIDGRCHCGNVSYEAEIDPEKVMICHCTDCQMLSGSAFRTVVPTQEGRSMASKSS